MQRVNRPRVFNYIVPGVSDPVIPIPSAATPMSGRGEKILFIIPLPLHRNSSHTPPMSMLSQPCILLCAENNNKCSCTCFKAQRLDFEIVDPWMPEGVTFAV